MYLLQSPPPPIRSWVLGWPWYFLLISCLIYDTYRSALPNSTGGLASSFRLLFPTSKHKHPRCNLVWQSWQGCRKGLVIANGSLFFFFFGLRGGERSRELPGAWPFHQKSRDILLHLWESLTQKKESWDNEPLFNNHRSGETSRSRVMGEVILNFISQLYVREWRGFLERERRSGSSWACSQPQHWWKSLIV